MKGGHCFLRLVERRVNSIENKHLNNYGLKKVQKSSTTIVYWWTADILVCPICQKLANCA
jgi:hypothetical protein